MTNPLTVIEQLTYLRYIRSLDEKEMKNEEFEAMSGGKMEKIFPASAMEQHRRLQRKSSIPQVQENLSLDSTVVKAHPYSVGLKRGYK